MITQYDHTVYISLNSCTLRWHHNHNFNNHCIYVSVYIHSFYINSCTLLILILPYINNLYALMWKT